MTDLKTLREVAERADVGVWPWSGPDAEISTRLNAYLSAFDPPTAKALLDRIEELEGALTTLQGERDRLVAMMTAGIALIDAANAGCPVRQDRRGAKGPMCPKCGATASQQCSPVAGTEYELVQDIRAALHPEPSTEKEGVRTVDADGPEAIPEHNPWRWYYATDEEFEIAHRAESREDAIAQGREDFEGEAFVVFEARHGEPRFDIFDADSVFERFEERNEELWSEDGSGLDAAHPDLRSDLEKRLAQALEEWGVAHGRPWRAWCLEHQRGMEMISATHPEPLGEGGGL